VLTALAVTGIAVTSGVLVKDSAPADDTAASVISAAEAKHLDHLVPADLRRDRANEASRSGRRTALDATTARAPNPESGRSAADAASKDPRAIARAMLPEFGFSDSEFSCLDALYVSESDWDAHADNPISSAYGIPQALTAGTHELPADYKTNPASQIRWGLGYIRESYGTPCSAWEFKQSNDWY